MPVPPIADFLSDQDMEGLPYTTPDFMTDEEANQQETRQERVKRLSQPSSTLELSPWEKFAQWVAPVAENAQQFIGTAGRSAVDLAANMARIGRKNQLLPGMYPPAVTPEQIESVGTDILNKSPYAAVLPETSLDEFKQSPLKSSAKFAENMVAGSLPWLAVPAGRLTEGIGAVAKEAPALLRAAGAAKKAIAEGLTFGGIQAQPQLDEGDIPGAISTIGQNIGGIAILHGLGAGKRLLTGKQAFPGVDIPPSPKDVPLSESTRSSLTPKEADFVAGKTPDFIPDSKLPQDLSAPRRQYGPADSFPANGKDEFLRAASSLGVDPNGPAGEALLGQFQDFHTAGNMGGDFPVNLVTEGNSSFARAAYEAGKRDAAGADIQRRMAPQPRINNAPPEATALPKTPVSEPARPVPEAIKETPEPAISSSDQNLSIVGLSNEEIQALTPWQRRAADASITKDTLETRSAGAELDFGKMRANAIEAAASAKDPRIAAREAAQPAIDRETHSLEDQLVALDNPITANALRARGEDPAALAARLRTQIAANKTPVSPMGEPGVPSVEQAPAPAPEKAQVQPVQAGSPTTSPVNEVAISSPRYEIEERHANSQGSVLTIRPPSEGAVRLMRDESGMNVIIRNDLGMMRVKDVEIPAPLRQRGIGSELYLQALQEAQRRGLGFESLDGRSPSANKVYERLERAGVPIQQNEAGSLVIPKEVLAGLNIDQIRARLENPYRKATQPPVSPVGETAPLSKTAPEQSVTEQPSFKLGDPVEWTAPKSGKTFQGTFVGLDQRPEYRGRPIVRVGNDTITLTTDVRPAQVSDSSQAMGVSHPVAAALQPIFGEKVAPDVAPVKSDNPAVEARWRAAQGYRSLSFPAKAKQALVGMKNAFTRHFIYLDTKHNPIEARAADILRKAEEVKALSAQKAFDQILSITKNLGKNGSDLVSRVLALRDMQKDIERGLYKEKELPFGYKTPEEVASDLGKFEAIVNEPQNMAVRQALVTRERVMGDVVKQLVDLKALPEEAAADPRYYHRQVLDYMEQKQALGNSSKGVTTGKKGFQNKRSGGGDFNTRYAEAEFEWLSGAHSIIETAKHREALRQTVDILPKLQEQAKAEGKTWQELIPDGYEVWQPKPGNKLFPALTITEKALDRLMGKEEVSLKEDGRPVGVREGLVLGGPKEQWVIPEGVAKTLDHMTGNIEGPVEKFAGGMQTAWKQYVLFNPLRATRYLLNNTSGDLDATIAADPKILKYVKRNTQELWSYMIKHDASPEVAARMQDLMSKRIVGSGLTMHEIPDISKHPALASLLSDNGNVVQRSVSRYWNGVKNFNNFRESILRASAYDRAMELLSNGKTVHWASNAAEIDALPDIQSKAAKLATELLGDYGNISQAGMYIRRHLAPFWSWQEINAPRYVRLFKNAAMDTEGSKGRIAGMAAITGARKVTELALKSVALSGMIYAWNRFRFPDDQEAIQAIGRGKPVLVLGKTPDGQLRYVRFEGALADALDWAGAGNILQDADEVSSGKSTVGDKLAEAVKAPVNRMVQAWEPYSKTTFELATGRSVYPNVFEEGKSFKLRSNPIRDKGEHLARVASLDKLWNWAHDKPTNGKNISPGWKIADALATYSVNPDESAYFETRRLASAFTKDVLKREPFGGGDPTDRQNALYYFKKASRWGDQDKAKKWLRKWVELSPPGTTVQDLERSLSQSLAAGNPLAGVPTKYQKQFIESLDPKQKAMALRAVNWYYGRKEK